MKNRILLENMDTILVTGGAGFIGFHLSKRLLEEGKSVAVFDNLNDYYDVNLKLARLEILKQFEKFVFIRGDLENKVDVNKVFNTFKPVIVVHLAAQAGVRYSIDYPEAYINSNLIGFFNVLESCRNFKVAHFVYASSSSVYGANKKIPFSVDDRVDQPVSLYAATKKSNELMAYAYSHLYHIPSTGLRFFTVYGPYGRPDMACYSFTKKILSGETIHIFNYGDMYRDFTYIDDVVEAVNQLIYCPPGADENGTRYKLYNIGNNKPEKLLDFIATLESCLGVQAQKEYLPMQAGDVYRTYADVSALVRDFDYKPDTSIKVGIEKFVDWYRRYYNHSFNS